MDSIMPRQEGLAASGDFFSRPADGTLCLRLAGNWPAGNLPLTFQAVAAEFAAAPTSRLLFETGKLEHWDSGLLTLLVRLKKHCDEQGVTFDDTNLPSGARRLLALAAAVPEQKSAPGDQGKTPFLERLADHAIEAWKTVVEMLDFLGEATVACGRLLTGRVRFRPGDLLLIMQECGAQALPIVSLISLLVGLILAFVGAVQLSMFGAQIYVASLVGISIVRVMGAIMTGIIMAGRTGAAFAARLGTMQVNEEIDALRTLGISPMEFLVLPRLVAMTAMMPLLCIYSDFMGMLGGFLVGIFTFNLVPMEYLNYTWKTVALGHIWVGLFHSAVFGVLVALCGCLQGIRCGRDASAVGRAATSAVVTGIVSIVVATAIITICCDILKF